MSKSIIPFLNPALQETNPNCDLCQEIDQMIHGILNDEFLDCNAQLDFLDSDFLVDGYSLLNVYEKNGYIAYNPDQILKLRKYKNVNANFEARLHNYLYPTDTPERITDIYEADAPTAIYGRWCKRCGARKLDIYDVARSENFNLLKMSNFEMETVPMAAIKWTDQIITGWTKTSLYKSWPDAFPPKEDQLLTEYLVENGWDKYKDTGYVDEYSADENSVYVVRLKNNLGITLKEITPQFELGQSKVKISWNDSESVLWRKTAIYRNGEKVYEYSTPRNKHSADPYTEIVLDGVIYRYQVVNYDIKESPIQVTEERSIYVPVVEENPPLPAQSVIALQEKVIQPSVDESNDTVYVDKDIIKVSWVDPINDFAGSVLRMGETFYVPSTETDGILAAKSMTFEDYGIQSGHTYYFRPFPYDREKVKRDIGEEGFVTYRNYNRQSAYASLVVEPGLPYVSDIQVAKYHIVDNPYNLADSELALSWIDPQDIDGAVWDHTEIRYKPGTTPLLNAADGRRAYTSTVRNAHSKMESFYRLSDLLVGQPYTIGIFPVTTRGITQVRLANQIIVTPGYYVPIREFNETDQMAYMGRWTADGNVYTLNTDTSICFFEAGYSVKYGATLTFDLKAKGIKNGGMFEVYFMDRDGSWIMLNQTTDIEDWLPVSLVSKPRSYLKIAFIGTKGKAPIEISMRNIKFEFNSH